MLQKSIEMTGCENAVLQKKSKHTFENTAILLLDLSFIWGKYETQMQQGTKSSPEKWFNFQKSVSKSYYHFKKNIHDFLIKRKSD